MKKILIVFTVILTAFLFTSCATMQSIPPEQRTHFFEANYNQTFKAIVSYCNDKGFPIVMVDKDLGIINTDWKMNDGVSKFLVGDQKLKINFAVSEVKHSEDSTRVMAIVSAVKSGAFGRESSITMTKGRAKDYYDIIYKGIEERIER